MARQVSRNYIWRKRQNNGKLQTFMVQNALGVKSICFQAGAQFLEYIINLFGLSGMKSQLVQELCPFIHKLQTILKDPLAEEIIEWTENGEMVHILNIGLFVKKILPKYFKHQNLSSFIRQLNIYGFFKAHPDQNIYKNDHFLRDDESAAKFIQRRSSKFNALMASSQNDSEEGQFQSIEKECTLLKEKIKILTEENQQAHSENQLIKKEIKQLNHKKQQLIEKAKQLNQMHKQKLCMGDREMGHLPQPEQYKIRMQQIQEINPQDDLLFPRDENELPYMF